jgi:hypothetical protein
MKAVVAFSSAIYFLPATPMVQGWNRHSARKKYPEYLRPTWNYVNIPFRPGDAGNSIPEVESLVSGFAEHLSNAKSADADNKDSGGSSLLDADASNLDGQIPHILLRMLEEKRLIRRQETEKDEIFHLTYSGTLRSL